MHGRQARLTEELQLVTLLGEELILGVEVCAVELCQLVLPILDHLELFLILSLEFLHSFLYCLDRSGRALDVTSLAVQLVLQSLGHGGQLLDHGANLMQLTAEVLLGLALLLLKQIPQLIKLLLELRLQRLVAVRLLIL